MQLTNDTFSRAARALDRLDRFVEGDGRICGAGDPGRLNVADAERIGDQLAAHGVTLEDSPTGVRWRGSTR